MLNYALNLAGPSGQKWIRKTAAFVFSTWNVFVRWSPLEDESGPEKFLASDVLRRCLSQLLVDSPITGAQLNDRRNFRCPRQLVIHFPLYRRAPQQSEDLF
ncbi:hypothetical protein BV898_08632 [Hypsibius exemplaris]|uniref:Uncharacterized protein n=1 Tax=Hypsibius exemplaris TaxID=2072580 RepID=A0A1W0WPU7_HYPEX|nr:hypothetical protein BV898_08632 [Hypsibius exemplaris]